MLELGKTYTTKSGKDITIIGQWPGLNQYSATNHLDYNEKGEAFMTLMYQGLFRAPNSDILLAAPQLNF